MGVVLTSFLLEHAKMGPPQPDSSIGIPKSDGSQHGTEPPRHIDNVAAALDEAIRNLQKGKIAFDVPQQMKQGKQERVEVRITRSLNNDMLNLLKENMRKSSQVDDIQVAPFMIVQLRDPEGSAFRITPLTLDSQAVAGDGYTPWDWSVVPLESGHHSLYLSVGTRFKLPNGEETKFEPVYEKDVAVNVDRVYETERFVSGNWQWLTATLLLPLIAFLWHHWKRKSKQTVLIP